ncbi:MAG: porphobilinogen synthase [Puniceicoccaceae bacterium]
MLTPGTPRPRRLRKNDAVRRLVRENQISSSDLIQPLFVIDGDGDPEAISSMPGQFRLNISDLCKECRELMDLGIEAVALFPSLDQSLKSEDGAESCNPETLILRAIREVKKAVPNMQVLADIALDPYTTHGHDGVLTEDGQDVDNDRTVAILSRMSVLNAEAGADFVAPSDMMDGRVQAIREALDEEGLTRCGIVAYSAKFNSAYYGPFRDAVGSSTAAGTTLLSKASYQLDPANSRQASREIELDELEAADVLMVKPAGPYLDIIRMARESTNLPVAAYQVSGEYAQIHAAAKMGWLDLKRCRDESLLAIKRAGADLILSYFSKDWAKDQ